MRRRRGGVLVVVLVGCALDPRSIGDETETSPAGGDDDDTAADKGDDGADDASATGSQPGTSGAEGGGSGSGGPPPGSTGDDASTEGGETSGDSGDDPPPPATCEDVLAAFEAETQAIRSCGDAPECGQVLTGTSCGCTRDWVARLDADTTNWLDLVELAMKMECELPFFSACDCPTADGFACEAGICTWNYS